MKDMLLLAGRQDRKQALEEIAFIVTERPQQIGAARAAALEFAIQDLEQCESMRDITRASERLTGILPRQEVFAEAVVEEIMHVTGCHPFLVQAVCSELIEHLNIENRERAEVQDVTSAGTQVLDNWWDTYFRDLWERSDQDQQTCLVALRNVGEGDALQIAQQCGLEEKTVRRTMQTLLKRDLVLQEESRYRIAAPIFCEWVERNS